MSGVLARVQVGAVLRPDHQGRRGPLTGLDLRGQLQRGGGVVLRDLGVVQQLRQVPGPRHVALDRGHLGRRRAAGRVDRQQAAREDQARRHHRRQRRPPGRPGSPGRSGGTGSPPQGGSGGMGLSQGGSGGMGPPGRKSRGGLGGIVPPGRKSRGGLGGIAPPEITERRPREHGAGQGEQEAEQRRAAHRDPAHVRRDRLAHRQPAPRKGVGPPVPHPLDASPTSPPPRPARRAAGAAAAGRWRAPRR